MLEKTGKAGNRESSSLGAATCQEPQPLQALFGHPSSNATGLQDSLLCTNEVINIKKPLLKHLKAGSDLLHTEQLHMRFGSGTRQLEGDEGCHACGYAKSQTMFHIQIDHCQAKIATKQKLNQLSNVVSSQIQRVS